MWKRLSLTILFLAVGCTKKPTQDAADASSRAPAPQTPVTELGLFERLALQASNKNLADPPTQRVVEALTRAGIAITQQQQQLGVSQAANYCLSLTTQSHLILSVCEYADAKAAEAGAQASRKALGAIQFRTVHVRRATTLSIIENPADAQSAEAKLKAIAAFESL